MGRFPGRLRGVLLGGGCNGANPATVTRKSERLRQRQRQRQRELPQGSRRRAPGRLPQGNRRLRGHHCLRRRWRAQYERGWSHRRSPPGDGERARLCLRQHDLPEGGRRRAAGRNPEGFAIRGGVAVRDGDLLTRSGVSCVRLCHLRWRARPQDRFLPGGACIKHGRKRRQQVMAHMTASDDSTQKASTDGARKKARAQRERTGVRRGERSVLERRGTGASVSTARA